MQVSNTLDQLAKRLSRVASGGERRAAIAKSAAMARGEVYDEVSQLNRRTGTLANNANVEETPNGFNFVTGPAYYVFFQHDLPIAHGFSAAQRREFREAYVDTLIDALGFERRQTASVGGGDEGSIPGLPIFGVGAHGVETPKGRKAPHRVRDERGRFIKK